MKEDIELNNLATQFRVDHEIDTCSPIDIFELCEKLENLTTVFYPLSDELSGLCAKSEDGMFMTINSKMSYGRQRFTVCHEIYHLFIQEKFTSIVCKKTFDSSDPTEKEADRFASFLLLPYSALSQFFRLRGLRQDKFVPLEQIIEIEQKFEISRAALLYRLNQEGYKYNKDTTDVNISQNAAKLGYPTKLYQPSPREKEFFTIGHYLNLASQVKNAELVSDGKYSEYLRDAFRYDLINSSEEGLELYD